jgi:hypothetical protein
MLDGECVDMIFLATERSLASGDAMGTASAAADSGACCDSEQA